MHRDGGWACADPPTTRRARPRRRTSCGSSPSTFRPWRGHPDGRVDFHPLHTLTDDDLHAVLAAVHADLAAADLDDTPDLDAALAACTQLALSTAAPSVPRLVEPRLSVRAFDMSLHAATWVDGRDRKRLERVARYLLRPALSIEAITAMDDGRVRLDIPRRGRFVTMTPHQLLAKLAALVPSPGTHLVRYHGVLMPTGPALLSLSA